jgi:hypothetical protein
MNNVIAATALVLSALPVIMPPIMSSSSPCRVVRRDAAKWSTYADNRGPAKTGAVAWCLIAQEEYVA